jgi:hypothetical protein
VEPPGIAALLVPVTGAGEELEPTDSMVAFTSIAPWSTVFIMASSISIFTMASLATFTVAALSAAAFAAMASSVVLVSAAFSATAAATETSLAIEADQLLLNPLGAIDVATLGSGCDSVATRGAYCSNCEGAQTAGGVMKSTEDGSRLNQPSKAPTTCRIKSESRSCSSRVVSLSLVYIQAR